MLEMIRDFMMQYAEALDITADDFTADACILIEYDNIAEIKPITDFLDTLGIYDKTFDRYEITDLHFSICFEPTWWD